MTREVVCLDKDRISQDCHYQDRPEAARECQEQQCGDTDTDIENKIDEEENEVENVIEEEYNEDHDLAEGSGYGNIIPQSLFSSNNLKCLQIPAHLPLPVWYGAMRYCLRSTGRWGRVKAVRTSLRTAMLLFSQGCVNTLSIRTTAVGVAEQLQGTQQCE